MPPAGRLWPSVDDVDDFDNVNDFDDVADVADEDIIDADNDYAAKPPGSSR